MRKLLAFLIAGTGAFACTQADPDQYAILNDPPVYGETNGIAYDRTNDYLSFFINDVEVGYIDSSGNVTMDGTITEGAQALADNTSTTYGTGSDSIIQYAASGSDPDSLFVGVGTDSRQLIIAEKGDVATDMAIAQQTNPTLNIHSADATDANDYIAIAHDQTNGVIDVGQGQVSIPDGITTAKTTGAITMTGTNATMVVKDNTDNTMCMGSSGATDLLCLDTSDDSEEVIIIGYAGTDAFSVEAGNASFDAAVLVSGDLSCTGAAGALTFPDGDETILLKDNDSTALDIGATGATAMMRFDTGDGSEQILTNVDVSVTGLTLTESGTLDTALRVAQTLNDTGARDASEVYSAVDVSVTTTDVTGWGTANTYLMRLRDGTTDRFSVVAESGATTVTGDLTVNGAAGSLTFPDGDETILLKDNDANALCIGLNDAAADFACFDMTNANEELNIVGTTATSAFRVDTGFATFDEQAVFSAGISSAVTGADAITLTGAAPTMTLKDNEAAALSIKSSGTGTDFIVIDTTTDNEELTLKGAAIGTSTFRVDVGVATFDEAPVCADGIDANGDILAGGGAGALTFDAASASIVTTDNSSTGLVIGASGATTMITLDTTDNAENVKFGNGVIRATVSHTAAAPVTLDGSDCGKVHFMGSGMDGNAFTLPATIAGCQLQFVYVGADHGALLDLDPAAVDAIHGTCVEMTGDTAVEFNGLDNNDIGCTKGTCNTGDGITLMGDGAEGWYVTACNGIWANN